ncbi:MAG: outer membrane protein assembly factor BamA [Pseudomonadota bacterium]
MKNLKRIYFFCLVFLLTPAIVPAQTGPKVGVAPFNILAQGDLSYLSQGVQELLGSHLLQRGLDVFSSEGLNTALKSFPAGPMDEQKARDLARALNLDFMIFGTLTQTGAKITIDSRLVEIAGSGQMEPALARVEGLDNLMSATEALSRDLAAKILGGNNIARIAFSGNKRIEADAVRRVINSKEGDIFNEFVVSEDLKKVYQMNYFDDVQVDVVDSPQGKVITFIVEEKPMVAKIEFEGAKRLEPKDLLEVLGYKQYSIVDSGKLKDSIDLLKAKYREKGHYKAEISYRLEPAGLQQVTVVYAIKENDRFYVRDIVFTGNKAFTDKELRKEMDTSLWNWFWWLTEDGILKESKLKNDVAKLSGFYYNNGYIRAKIGTPDVVTTDDGLRITIPVEEGPQFKVGRVNISGELIGTRENLFKKLESKEGDIYSRDKVRKDVQTLTNYCADFGYAFADVQPLTEEREDVLTVDLTYDIQKKNLVYFERINIVGNTKTRDKVIRRELRVVEGKLFTAKGMRLSTTNLHRLGFFEDVKLGHSQGSTPDKMNLDVEVKERATGAFAVGAGYSSFNSVFGTVRVSEENLFGRGQQVQLAASAGAKSTEYTLGFTEPWLFDIPLEAGFDLYDRKVEYDAYDKRTLGGDIRFGYPLMDYVRAAVRYLYEENRITDVAWDAAYQLRELRGLSTTSAVKLALRRDNRNQAFNPTAGTDSTISVEHAGGPLAGTNNFTRYIADSGTFISLGFWDLVFFTRGQVGYVVKGPAGKLPAYEKFYLGGINSMRGFDWGSISPEDPLTGDKIGGEKMALANMELIFPLFKSIGLLGVIFFDQGNVWAKNDFMDMTKLKRSAGGGIRYYSPFGPLRLEYGRVIHPVDDERDNWEFSVGTFF